MKKLCLIASVSFLVLIAFNSLGEITDENWLLFNQIFSLVKDTYVEDKKSSEIIAGALQGLAKATGPESGYLTKEKYSLIHEREKMEYQIPFYVTKEDGFARIIAPFSGRDFGVESGDILKSINGKSIFDLSYPETISEMKRDKEIEVTCAFMKKGTLKVFEKTIKTSRYNPPVILKIDEKTAVIQLPCLESPEPTSLKDSLKNFSTVILDLRFCASGDVESALRWAGVLFGKGELRSSSKSGEQKIEFDGEGILSKTRCFILTDETTARGGEVLALAGAQKSEIIGGETFGFAAQHMTLTLKNGDKLVILKGYFLDKNGEEIKDKPIQPNIQLKNLSREREKKNYLEILSKLN